METSERLAVLETEVKQVKETNEKILDRVDKLTALETRTYQAEEERGAILTQLKEMQSDLTRFKGFAGGVVFVASALGAFFGIIKAWFLTGAVPH